MDHEFVQGTCARCGRVQRSVDEPADCPGEVQLASRGERFGAQVLDGFVAAMIAILALVATLALAGFDAAPPVAALAFFHYTLLGDGYSGRSLGKRLLRMQVVRRRSGHACGWVGSLVRNLSLFLLGPIDWVFILGQDRRRLGDLIAGTVVLRHPSGTRPWPLHDGRAARLAHHALGLCSFAAIVWAGHAAQRAAQLSDVRLFNALPVAVVVRLGERVQQVPAGGEGLLEDVLGGDYPLLARTLDGRLIEERRVEVPRQHDLVAYNVLGAEPLYLLEETYGEVAEDAPGRGFVDLLGERWIVRADVDYFFEPSPDEIILRRHESYRRVWSLLCEERGWRAALVELGAQQRHVEQAELARRIVELAGDEAIAIAAVDVLSEEGAAPDHRDLLEHALEEYPLSLELHRRRQDRLLWQGDLEQAVALYSDLLAAHPDSAVMGYLDARLSPPAEALEKSEVLLGLHPGDPGLLALQARTLVQLGEHERAQPVLEQALAAQAVWPLGLVEAAAANLLALGRGEEAERLVEASGQHISPTSFHYAVLAARVHLALGNDALPSASEQVLRAGYGDDVGSGGLVVLLRAGAPAPDELDPSTLDHAGLEAAVLLARALAAGPEQAVEAFDQLRPVDARYLDPARMVALACALLDQERYQSAEEVLGSVQIPFHVLERTLLDDRDNPYAAALPWDVRAVLELFDGLQHPPGTPERAAHLGRAQRTDPWRGFAWRAAARWL